MDWASWISAAVLAATAVLNVYVWQGSRRMRDLSAVGPDVSALPRVSLVIPARNEAATVEPALRSVMALEYPQLEVIAVDDRSEDGTGEILDRLAGEFPGLRVAHVTQLPRGWLGKNHAMHQGSLAAGGEYIVFTDADVVYETSALRRAAAHCRREGLDHFTILPSVPIRHPLLQATMVNGLISLYAMYSPWKLRDSPRSFIGVGAFNMVRAAAYRARGGHASLALEVLDDVVLGKVMKRDGGRSDAMTAHTLMSVEIYKSLGEMLGAVRKNAFTFVDYSIAKLAAASVLVMLGWAWPWVGAAAFEGAARWMNLASLAISAAVYAAFTRDWRFGFGCMLCWPVVAPFALGVLWWVALATLATGRIAWRGTSYSLDEIRRGHQPLL